MRDQASEEEKCLTFADLLAGPAKNWYRQLSRSTRNKWSDLPRSFLIQYCGLGVSVARQYYHARRRPEESPLDYLYRLRMYPDNVQRSTRTYNTAPTATTKHVRAEQIRSVVSESESGSDGSDSDGDNHRRIYLAADQDATPKAEPGMEKIEQVPITHKSTDQTPPDRRSWIQSGGSDRNRCSHCGSKKHSDLGCWRRLTCHKCGKQGHPADHCLFLCRGHASGICSENVKLGLSPGWNPKSVDQGSKIPDLRGNTYGLNGNCAAAISSVRQVDDYPRSEVTMTPTDQEDIPVIQKPSQVKEIRISEFRQAKIADKISNERRVLLLDTGAEVSIVDTAFARKVGCYIDTSQIQDCVGIGESVYRTEGRTQIKITMAGSLVYCFDIWVGDLAGQDAILGMDFMVPAGIRLDLAYGSISLPDEVRIQLSGRRQLYRDKASLITVGEHIQIEIGQSVELQLHLRMSDHEKFWVTRGDRWVPTVANGLRKRRYLQIANISNKAVTLQEDGITSSGFRDLYTSVYGVAKSGPEATVERESEQVEFLMESAELIGDRPSYPSPRVILKRPEISQIQVISVLKTKDQLLAESDPPDPTPNQSVGVKETSQGTGHVRADQGAADLESDPNLHYHEGNDLYAEDVDQEMVILPEINPTTDEVKIEDIQVGDPEIQTTAEIERLRQKIWIYRHLLIGKGNALPPAARGVVCDIDVGDAKPIAQRVRKITYRFREKLSDLIKGLISAKMIRYSRSPWASPIMVIVKKSGVDIRLCFDYRLVNSFTQLVIYPMPLINDLLEDLDKVLWYCSLDRASGVWVVTMTDRARAISAFVTPFGLFEWNHMPFGLMNAPQI
ncbi:Hypothetical protein PHPALM_6130 [Phytophthora palmivora]|uniref:CCHC-type domain-containing protein n=1 Tax=Phytophthora palmivora TaxID=4796 RepID=A0A2P4YFL8_9STRA|nr:Hypothetical protein PHPALM_6130 [Phytophthora palmivora]